MKIVLALLWLGGCRTVQAAVADSAAFTVQRIQCNGRSALLRRFCPCPDAPEQLVFHGRNGSDDWLPCKVSG